MKQRLLPGRTEPTVPLNIMTAELKDSNSSQKYESEYVTNLESGLF